MENTGMQETEDNPSPAANQGKTRKAYLIDALLIVFSVLLALILNELRNSWQEKSQTKQLLNHVRTELIHNKKLLEEQYQYHKGVLHNIDSALRHETYRNQVFANDVFHLTLLGQEGVGLEDFDHTAWEIAKSKDIISKVDLHTMSLLNNIDKQHRRIEKIEDEVTKVIFTPGSGKKENTRETLTLLSYAYHGWAVDRIPGLLKNYDHVIKNLERK
jgi:hypothetical protein